jgi:hypothetical protein
MSKSTKRVKMGPPSPEFKLPRPVQSDSEETDEDGGDGDEFYSPAPAAPSSPGRHDDDDDLDDAISTTTTAHHTRGDDVSSLDTTASFSSSSDTPTSDFPQHPSQSAIRRIVEEAFLKSTTDTTAATADKTVHLDGAEGQGGAAPPSSSSTASPPRKDIKDADPPPPPAPNPNPNPNPTPTSDSDSDGDIDSDGFYWRCGVDVTPSEYSNVLDKALQRKSQRLYEMLLTMPIPDKAVQLAVKEVVATDERLPCILKRMHQSICLGGTFAKGSNGGGNAGGAGGSRGGTDTGWESFAKPVFYSKHPEDLKRLVKEELGKGYLLKHGELYHVEVPKFLCIDAEHNKLEALQAAVRGDVKAYDQRYKRLRESFRDILLATPRQCTTTTPSSEPTAGSGSESKGEPPPQMLLPVEWLTGLLSSSPANRFNAQTFIRDCKIGKLETEPRCFANDDDVLAAFAESLNAFVTERQKGIVDVGRHCLFDLKRGDDVVSRFLRSSGDINVDVTLLFHKLSVLLAKECVLLRLHINYAYPNVAMLLHLIESLEQNEQRRLLAPFFPPLDLDHLQTQVTNMGIVEDDLLQLTTVYHGQESEEQGTLTLPPHRKSAAHQTQHQEREKSHEPLRFSNMFQRLF